MAIQFLRGNTEDNDGFTGPVGSLTIDTQAGSIRVHDGTTAGGWVIASVDPSGSISSVTGSSPIVISGTVDNPVVSIQAASASQNGYLSSSDKNKLDGISAGAEANTVDSVNGKTGTVSITASDVGAALASHTHAISEIVGLVAALSEKVDKNNPTFSGTITIDEGVI